MTVRFHIDQRVVALCRIRNDGSFPDPELPRGAVLVEEGDRGYVVEVGSFLQKHVIYAIYFDNGRLVGCLEEELAPTTEGAPATAGARGAANEA